MVYQKFLKPVKMQNIKERTPYIVQKKFAKAFMQQYAVWNSVSSYINFNLPWSQFSFLLIKRKRWSHSDTSKKFKT